MYAYDVNVNGTKNALDIAKDQGCGIFVPTSIGIFGGNAYDKDNTSVDSVLQPDTMYGVTKAFNENLGKYYHEKFGVDFRCLRYSATMISRDQRIPGKNLDYGGTFGYATCKSLSSLYNYIYILQKCFSMPLSIIAMIAISILIPKPT